MSLEQPSAETEEVISDFHLLRLYTALYYFLDTLPYPLLLPSTPSLLPLQRPYSFSRPRTVISNSKFGLYMVYIHIHTHDILLPVCLFDSII